MLKSLKKPIIALAIVSAVFAASVFAPAGNHGYEKGQVVGFFLPDLIECM